MKAPIPYHECLCGGREDDRGQAVPFKCHACGRITMGEWKGCRRVSPPAEGALL
ncbi:hypothetical protein [Sphingobium amiense]|uniref:hypothetical protein n=1 Tax=Sphingobium amiense TaxID=135719 RepID=UPI000A8DEA34|nr:hypothetical protein [Sphingobium amiense]